MKNRTLDDVKCDIKEKAVSSNLNVETLRIQSGNALLGAILFISEIWKIASHLHITRLVCFGLKDFILEPFFFRAK